MSVHIAAKKGEIAKTVLQPGDPLRAKYIADNFLQEVKLVSQTRNIFYFTGKYKGVEVSEFRALGFIPTNSSHNMMWKPSSVLEPAGRTLMN